MRRRAKMLQLLLVLLLGLAAGWTAQQARALRSERYEEDVVYVPSGDILNFLSLGYQDLIADFFWLRTVTYYGEWRQGDHGISFFRQLLDTVVTLDPHFTEAYRLGAVVLADDMNSMEEGLSLLDQGMQEMPDNWWLPFEAGFLEYTVAMDDAAAYRWFRRAAEYPDAPEIPRRFAAFVASRAGKLEVSYELWRFVAETTTNQAMRKKALQYMDDLEKAIRGEGPVPEWARRRRVINGRSSKDPDA